MLMPMLMLIPKIIGNMSNDTVHYLLIVGAIIFTLPIVQIYEISICKHLILIVDSPGLLPIHPALPIFASAACLMIPSITY